MLVRRLLTSFTGPPVCYDSSVVSHSAPYSVSEAAKSVSHLCFVGGPTLAYGEGSCKPVAGKPGVYDLRAYNPHTGKQQRRRVKNCKNRRAGLIELEKFQRQLAAVGPLLDMNCSVGEMIDHWLEQRKPNWSPNTYRGYSDKLKKVRLDFGAERLRKVDGQAGAMFLDHWYSLWQKNGATAAEVFHTHRVLSSMLHQAEKWGYIDRAATDLATAPSYDPPPIVEIESVTVREFIEGCTGRKSPHLAEAVIVSSSTGLRRGELCALRWPDFRPDRMQMLIDSAVKYGLDWADDDEMATSKGNRSRKVLDGPTKTKRERPISLHPLAVLVLLALKEQKQRACASAGIAFNEDGYIFAPDPTGTRPWKPDSYSQAVRRATYRPCSVCGFKWKRNRPEKCAECGGMGRVRAFNLNLLDMRRFHATHALGEGVDPRTVAGRHGADVKVLMRHYAAFIPSKDVIAAKVVGDLFLPDLSITAWSKGTQAAS
jgi:integrase